MRLWAVFCRNGGRPGSGTAIGMTMAPSRREIKRAAHRAAKSVSDAVETLTDAMGM